MATVASKPITADEFYEFVHRPENRDRHFELENGEIIEMSRPGELHGIVCGNISWVFGGYIRKLKRGRLCVNDSGLLLGRDPDTVKGPDLFFYPTGKKYEDIERKYSDEMPLLAIEVLSPTDRMGKVLRRIEEFLTKGIRLVWVVQPESRTVTIFRAGQQPQDFGSEDTLKALDELPDFECRVGDFFEVFENQPTDHA